MVVGKRGAERDDAAVARRFGEHVRAAVTRRIGDVDDRTAAGSDQVRHHGLARQKDRGQVAFDHVVPLCLRRGDDGRCRSAFGGNGDERVDAFVARLRRRDRAFDGGSVSSGNDVECCIAQGARDRVRDAACAANDHAGHCGSAAVSDCRGDGRA